MNQEKEIFSEMLLDLEAMEDDLIANRAPVEAVQHMQATIALCKEHFQTKYGSP
jgi:hypothetical protein